MLYPMYFQPLSPQQANPFGYGLLQGAQTSDALANSNAANMQTALLGAKLPYAGQAAQQDLLTKQLANQLSAINVQYQPQTLQSKIALAKAQTNAQNALPGLYGAEAAAQRANAGLTGAQTNLLQQKTPYLVQQAQGQVFTDPIMQRAFELGIAQRGNAIPQAAMNILGLGNLSANGSSAAPGSPQSQQLPPSPLPGMGGNLNPLNAPKAFSGDSGQNWLMYDSPYNPIQLQALTAAATTQAKNQATQSNTNLQNVNDAAQQSVDLDKYLDQFKNAYDASKETGAAFGKLPALSSSAQLVDSAAANLQLALAKAQDYKKFTNLELGVIGNAKPNRAMNEDAINQLYTFLKARNQRSREQAQFYNALTNAGVDPQTVQVMWNNYNNQRPYYDFKNNKPNSQYVNSFTDYMTPEALQAARSGKQFTPKTQSNQNVQPKGVKPDGSISVINGATYKKINGQWYQQ